ncbi:hypothetical protein DFH08DRAFT_962353 [Mycena albidolilacea]|uniref:Uncharacterized protein n=1 Tax=Mycena albidolilacea TaxID=1033008 RepID=A0AAD7EQ05_9AGAR|nr:hypothetical protein DFH08DRAFT_962353 [Mycena albidolilacea]
MESLQDAMGVSWNSARVGSFRNVVWSTAQHLKLDLDTRSERQDQTKWNKLLERVVEKFQDLDTYQGQWPVAMFYNRRVAGRKHYRHLHNKSTSVNSDSDDDERPLNANLGRLIGSRKTTSAAPRPENTAVKRTANSDSGSDEPSRKRSTRYFMDKTKNVPTSFSSANKRYYVGKNPNDFRRPLSSSSSSNVSPPRKNTSARAVALSDDSEPDEPLSSGSRADQSFRQGSSQTASQKSQVSSSQPTSQGSPTQSQTEAALTDWPVWCVFCQKKTPPTVPDQYTPELRQLFPISSKVPAIFAAIGILHDIHLRILVSIPKVECDAFLRSFIGIQYTQWERVQISAALDTYAKEHADDPLPYWEMEGCPIHENQHEVDVPSELLAALHRLGMEEVGPAAVFLGINTNADYRKACGSDRATIKDLLGHIVGITPSPFQKLMLELALKPAS